MDLFRNRPLALASLALIATVFFSFFLSTVWLLALFFVLGVALLLILGFSFKERMGYIRFVVFLAVGAALLGALRVSVDRSFVSDPIERYMDQTVETECVVREINYSSEDHSELVVAIKRLDGQTFFTRGILRESGSSQFSVGDRFVASVRVRSLDFESSYEGAKYSYLGDGVRVVLVLEDPDLATIKRTGEDSFLSLAQSARMRLAERILSVCQGEEGKLMSAMLLGTRNLLANTTVRDFGRAGVSHLLALSGLHLAMLVGILDRLLLFFGIDKRFRLVPIFLFCFGYLALTGFNYSMIRAVVMLGMFYMGFLFNSDYDGMTSLCFCAAAILLVTPTAIFSASFRMTFLATFGILIVAEAERKAHFKLPKRNKVRRALLKGARFVKESLMISVITIVTVLPVTWLTFGELSLMTPLANLILVPIAPVLFLAALVVLVCPVGPVATVCGAVGKLVLLITDFFSRQRGMLSLQYDFVPYILIPLFLIAATLLIVDLKKRKCLLFFPILLAAAAFAICLGVVSCIHKKEVRVAYTDTHAVSGAVIDSENRYCLYETTGTYEGLNSLWRIAKERCATEVESLVFSEYCDAQTYVVPNFCGKVRVRNLYLPSPQDQRETELFDALRESAEALGVRVIVYQKGIRTPICEDAALLVSDGEERTEVLLFANGERKSFFFEGNDRSDIQVKEYVIRHESS